MKSNFIVLLLISINYIIGSMSYAGEQIAFVGQVVYVPLEGGFYGLINSRREQFVATNLPDLLKEDGLSVTLQAFKAKNEVGLHMWGQAIDLQSIAINTCTRLPSK